MAEQKQTMKRILKKSWSLAELQSRSDPGVTQRSNINNIQNKHLTVIPENNRKNKSSQSQSVAKSIDMQRSTRLSSNKTQLNQECPTTKRVDSVPDQNNWKRPVVRTSTTPGSISRGSSVSSDVGDPLRNRRRTLPVLPLKSTAVSQKPDRQAVVRNNNSHDSVGGVGTNSHNSVGGVGTNSHNSGGGVGTNLQNSKGGVGSTNGGKQMGHPSEGLVKTGRPPAKPINTNCENVGGTDSHRTTSTVDLCLDNQGDSALHSPVNRLGNGYTDDKTFRNRMYSSELNLSGSQFRSDIGTRNVQRGDTLGASMCANQGRSAFNSDSHQTQLFVRHPLVSPMNSVNSISLSTILQYCQLLTVKLTLTPTLENRGIGLVDSDFREDMMGHAPLSGKRASIGCNNGSAFRRVNKSPNVQSPSLVRVDYLAEVHQDGLNVGDYLIEVDGCSVVGSKAEEVARRLSHDHLSSLQIVVARSRNETENKNYPNLLFEISKRNVDNGFISFDSAHEMDALVARLESEVGQKTRLIERLDEQLRRCRCNQSVQMHHDENGRNPMENGFRSISNDPDIRDELTRSPAFPACDINSLTAKFDDVLNDWVTTADRPVTNQRCQMELYPSTDVHKYGDCSWQNFRQLSNSLQQLDFTTSNGYNTRNDAHYFERGQRISEV